MAYPFPVLKAAPQKSNLFYTHTRIKNEKNEKAVVPIPVF